MGENSPKLLDLMVQKDKKCWGGDFGESCDEKKLELRLGLPYEEKWQNKQGVIKRDPHISSSYFNGGGGGIGIGCGKVQEVHPWNSSSVCVNNGKVELSVMEKNASQACYTRMVDLQKPEKKVFSPLSVKTSVPNTSQKRAAPAPVVGWPPIRSFRKNLASSSSAKTGSEPQNGIPRKPVNAKQPTEISNKGQFVKINMDGVAIGRKVDLNAYNCYENLSSVVETLFRALLAAQNDSSADGIEKNHDKQEPITGLLDGTGEYTLVYEDNEGDRMLVGDVPWHMFVSTVKRLRVLKSSDLSTLNRDVKGKAIVEGAS